MSSAVSSGDIEMRRDRITMQQACRDYHLTHKRTFRRMPWRVWMVRPNSIPVIVKLAIDKGISK